MMMKEIDELPDSLDVFPPGDTGEWPLLLARAAVHGEQPAARALQHPRILHRLVNVIKDSHFTGYGDADGL